ncbi:M1 family metallopeptidase [Sandarakinorhabdus sp. DWP1-3-1]|uniref:M1 family metallopeptidase n=1 Tax=Sandarakinorhabdus sp. DWP1-3-1 TaxID=2804627 RepID=UPI003CF36BFC
MKFLASAFLATSAALAIAAAPAPPLGRLPAGITPTAYRLDLTVDPSKAGFTGRTEIDATLATATSTVFLHGRDLKVTRATATAGGRTVTARYADVDSSGVARLDLATPLPAGKVTFAIDYAAGFRTGAEGLFHAKVGNDWYAWTQMEPIDARRMFPGFDEPGFKTPFTVTLTVPTGAKAFANTPEVSATAKGAVTVHKFAPTKPLPTYLVAIGVGPFDTVSATMPPNAVRKRPLDFRVIGTRGQAPRMAITARETPKLLALLEDYFGSPYPYEKLDALASPIQGGAMENAGLILYSDDLILLDSDAPPSQLRGFGEVSAHEMAHQWFGDLVTPTWWTDIWLNESFASWMGNKVGDLWRPDLGIGVSEVADAFEAMDTDSLGRGRPMRQTIDRNDQIASAFDGITYRKGAQVVSMFEAFVGPEKFRAGVRLHMQRHAHGNASAEDFFASVGEAAGDPRLVPALRTFTDQTGVPVVTVEDRPDGIRLRQSRYVPIGVATDRMQRTWSIPMCLSRGEGRTCTLFDKAETTLPPLIGTELALMPNAGGAGYYRFSPAGGWNALIDAAPSLPGRDAMAVADSLWADFAAGKTDFATVARGAKALAGNPERLAAIAIGYHLKDLGDTLLTPAQRPQYRRMMAAIYAPRLAALGFDPRRAAHAGDAMQQQLLRASLVSLMALEARDAATRSKLVAAARAYLGGDNAAIEPSYRQVALAVAVQEGGVPFMESLSKRMIASDDPLFRAQASVAIGMADSPAAVAAAQRLALVPGVQSLETVRTIGMLGSQPAARDATVDFVNANFTRVMESYPGFSRTSIIGLYRGYCDTAAAGRIEAMVRPKLKTIGGGELELSQAKEQVGQCAALKAAKGDEIGRVLAAY